MPRHHLLSRTDAPAVDSSPPPLRDRGSAAVATRALFLALLALLAMGLVVPAPALAAPGSANASHASDARTSAMPRGRVTLRKLNSVVAGSSWKVEGRLTHTGRSKNKTVVIEWRAGTISPRVGARVMSGARWQRVGIKRHLRDGKYRISFTSDKAGVSHLRARVVSKGRTLAVSSARTLTVLAGTPETPATPAPTPGQTGIRSDLLVAGGTQTMDQFLDTVSNDVRGYWSKIWAANGYAAPTVHTYWPAPGEAIYQACGGEGVGAGTFADDSAAYYCSTNDYIVISQAMAQRLWSGQAHTSDGAAGQVAGDFSVAYAVAHEWGHDIQYELGWGPAMQAGQIPVRSSELHADCLAGTWMNSAYHQGVLEAGDVEEALGTAAALGNSTMGSAGHGSPEERSAAVWHGYSTGQPSACDGYIKQWW